MRACPSRLKFLLTSQGTALSWEPLSSSRGWACSPLCRLWRGLCIGSMRPWPAQPPLLSAGSRKPLSLSVFEALVHLEPAMPWPGHTCTLRPFGCTGILRGFCNSACAWPHPQERAEAVSTGAQPALPLLSRIWKALSHPPSSPGVWVTLYLFRSAVRDTKVQKAQGGIAETRDSIPFASLSKMP